jgi:peptidoglycan/LPS O-acetylase OafA/YrhL
MRALAICLVLWSHSLAFLPTSHLDAFLHYKPVDGVDVFFVLSGFLIGRLMLDEWKNNALWTLPNLARFVARRWLRTIPAYWTVLGVLACVGGIWMDFIPVQVAWMDYLLFTQNLCKPLLHFFWESWSLAVEEWFYLCWPFAVWIFSRCIPYRQAYILAAALMLLVALVSRHLAFDPALDDFWMDVKIRKMVLLRWDSIAVGLIGAAMMHQKSFFQKRWLLCFIGCAVIVLLSLFDLSNQSYFKQVIYFLIVACAIVLCIPAALHVRINENIITAVVRYIAKISYSLYLVNLCLVAGFIQYQTQLFGGVQGWMAFLCFWILSFAWASVLHMTVERYFMRWRDRYLRSSEKA